MKRILICLCASLFFFACPIEEKAEEPDSSSVETAATDIIDCSFTDSRDNQTYKCVAMGNQTWMAENLKYAGENGELGTCERYSHHAPTYIKDCDIYGRIYTWENAANGQICPEGWRVPSKEEFEELIAFAGGEEIAGIKLRAKEGWLRYAQERNGTDDYGFSALAAGKSPQSPPFSCPEQEPCPGCPPPIACTAPMEDGRSGETGWWWSSTEADVENAFSMEMRSYYENDKAFVRSYPKANHFPTPYSMSVRCVRDY